MAGVISAPNNGADAITGYGFLSRAPTGGKCAWCTSLHRAEPSVIKLLGARGGPQAGKKAAADAARSDRSARTKNGSEGGARHRYPVIIKAVAGAAGAACEWFARRTTAQLLRMATREAEAACGTGDV